ncbi:MAG: IS66 family transposase, partial [Pseudonocardiaceae bacterium]
VQFLPAHRVVALLESLTGAAPSVGFVHGMLTRTAGLLTVTHDRIATLVTQAHAVSCDETPLRVGPRTPKPGKKKAERYLLVFSHRALHPLPARVPIPGHVHQLGAHRTRRTPRRVSDHRALPLPELRQPRPGHPGPPTVHPAPTP